MKEEVEGGGIKKEAKILRKRREPTKVTKTAACMHGYTQANSDLGGRLGPVAAGPVSAEHALLQCQRSSPNVVAGHSSPGPCWFAPSSLRKLVSVEQN